MIKEGKIILGLREEPAPGEWVWPNFSPAELMCPCDCERLVIDVDALNRLQAIRYILAFPLVVTSAYRCPAHNRRVSHTGADGPHTTGKAFDIHILGLNASKLEERAVLCGFIGRGRRQHGHPSKRIIHLDTISERIWSYET